MSRVEGRGFHVEGRGYHVEGNNFLIFLKKKENKWKTNKNNLKNKWRVDISIHISSTYWVGRGEGQNTWLDNRFLNISDCLRTSSALLAGLEINFFVREPAGD